MCEIVRAESGKKGEGIMEIDKSDLQDTSASKRLL